MDIGGGHGPSSSRCFLAYSGRIPRRRPKHLVIVIALGGGFAEGTWLVGQMETCIGLRGMVVDRLLFSIGLWQPWGYGSIHPSLTIVHLTLPNCRTRRRIAGCLPTENKAGAAGLVRSRKRDHGAWAAISAASNIDLRAGQVKLSATR